MSYVDAVLQPGEIVKHRAKLHWIVFWRGALLLLVAGLMLLIPVQGTAYIAIEWVAAIVALAGLALLIQSAYDQWITEIAVTSSRVIYKRGLIRRRTAEMNMDKVETVEVDQSILGRLLDYGTVDVRGTGGGIEDMKMIAAPLGFRSAITSR